MKNNTALRLMWIAALATETPLVIGSLFIEPAVLTE